MPSLTKPFLNWRGAKLAMKSTCLPGFDRLPMRYGGPLLPDEMMVFCGFDDTLLSRFLSRYRQTNIAPIPLKAGVTPNNLFWDTLQLHRELAEEHRRLG